MKVLPLIKSKKTADPCCIPILLYILCCSVEMHQQLYVVAIVKTLRPSSSNIVWKHGSFLNIKCGVLNNPPLLSLSSFM